MKQDKSIDSGFQDNMVPGEIESAQLVDSQNGQHKRGQSAKLLFALAALLFAGGWSYANQGDLKQALGFGEEPKMCASSSCCSQSTALASTEVDSETSCAMAAHAEAQCPMSAALAESEGPKCCAQSQQAAKIAALLAETDPEQPVVAAIESIKSEEEDDDTISVDQEDALETSTKESESTKE